MTPPAGLTYVPEFLDGGEQIILLEQLRPLVFAHDTFRGQRLKRGYMQFGYAYASTGRKLLPAPEFPPFVTLLLQRAIAQCPKGAAFDQCIVTHYPAGAGIGWHTDAPQFGDCIIAVSVAGNARLQFRANGTSEVAYELSAAPGSLYLMHGAARWNYQHQITPVKVDRYSLTFRHVKHAP